MPLREVDQLLYPAVYAAVMSLDIDREGKDAAAAKLALRMARVIDETADPKMAGVLWHLGAELLKVLESLGATPAARAAMTKKPAKPADAKPSGLAALRAARSS